ncbi:MAG: DUF47 family protein [Patescibacteria group bacterium]|nr:DUF47 family protein [Patescibacteria group bacterium]
MSGIIDLLVPREKRFLEYIDKQVIILDECTKKLNKITKNGSLNSKNFKTTLGFISKKSDESDDIARDTIAALHKTFITPIDREEIKSLALSINHFIDSIEEVANGIYDFKIKKFDDYFLKQIKILNESVDVLRLIFEKPLFLKRNRQYIEDIKELERKGDSVFRKAIGELFNNGHTPIEIIKQKELYEAAEDAIDDAKNIVDILETVLINNS